MKNLANPAWIKFKGLLFLLLGLLTATLLFFDKTTIKVALLLVVALWSFCRFCYFAFYVIERNADPSYRFSGLLSLARYLIGKQRRRPRAWERGAGLRSAASRRDAPPGRGLVISLLTVGW